MSVNTTNGRIEDLGNGVGIICAPSIIVATDSKTGTEVARFTNWEAADAFIYEAMASGCEYDFNEVVA